MSSKMELVSPGGSLEKIEYAYHYGADAVYLGLPDFSLRSRINEFTPAKLEKAVKLARKLGRKIYFTLNIYAHERHVRMLEKHLKFAAKVKPDAIIVSDPGIVRLAKKFAPKIKIHLSTQANTTNSEAVRFWSEQGVSRIILAREVTLREIKEIRKKCPKIELECFSHGAMCMSYSGRCLLSRWMKNRSANLGDCVQPCRWPYQAAPDREKEIVLSEDEHGTYFMNSRDLCLIEHLEELKRGGVDAVKIEGRTKSVCYVAVATKAYRQVLNALNSGKKGKNLKVVVREAKEELEKLVNRGYSTGFLFGGDQWENDFAKSHKKNRFQFVGEIVGEGKNCWHKVRVHNALKIKEKVEIVTPKEVFSDSVLGIKTNDRGDAESAHGGKKNIYLIQFRKGYSERAILRKKL